RDHTAGPHVDHAAVMGVAIQDRTTGSEPHQYERARIAIRSGSSSESGIEPSSRIRQRTVIALPLASASPSSPTADQGPRAQPVWAASIASPSALTSTVFCLRKLSASS